mmetsp:Transcript_15347/g.58024  ORF Transcript_15347/g.58024 Transcript_15347/m.58024 type:complete len:231 (+) Transcript_15347:539-1231(+)
MALITSSGGSCGGNGGLGGGGGCRSSCSRCCSCSCSCTRWRSGCVTITRPSSRQRLLLAGVGSFAVQQGHHRSIRRRPASTSTARGSSCCGRECVGRDCFAPSRRRRILPQQDDVPIKRAREPAPPLSFPAKHNHREPRREQLCPVFRHPQLCRQSVSRPGRRHSQLELCLRGSRRRVAGGAGGDPPVLTRWRDRSRLCRAKWVTRRCSTGHSRGVSRAGAGGILPTALP